MQGSLRVTDNGSFNVYSKSQEYKFTPDGLVRKGGRRDAEPLDSQLSYKVLPTAPLQLREIQIHYASHQLAYMLTATPATPADIRAGCAHCQGPGAGSQQCGELGLYAAELSKALMHAPRLTVLPRVQVYKAFLARCGKFVAIKKINCFERVQLCA